MTGVFLGILAVLILLFAAAVYSSLLVAKKTDRIIARQAREDEEAPPLLVRFPDSVLRSGWTSVAQSPHSRANASCDVRGTPAP